MPHGACRHAACRFRDATVSPFVTFEVHAASPIPSQATPTTPAGKCSRAQYITDSAARTAWSRHYMPMERASSCRMHAKPPEARERREIASGNIHALALYSEDARANSIECHGAAAAAGEFVAKYLLLRSRRHAERKPSFTLFRRQSPTVTKNTTISFRHRKRACWKLAFRHRPHLTIYRMPATTMPSRHADANISLAGRS